MMMKIAIVDYGMSNLHSVQKSVQAAQKSAGISAKVQLAQSAEIIQNADKIIFPGQGAMPDCMHALHSSGLGEAIQDALKNKPFLGICVGAQLLFEHSEEGETAGLSWFDGRVRRFDHHLRDQQDQRLKVPHMGWNRVHQAKQHPLFASIDQDERFYFVHSYYFAPDKADIVLATSDYPDEFACIVGKDNVFACQFHAEKSHDVGLQLLSNFLMWDGQGS